MRLLPLPAAVATAGDTHGEPLAARDNFETSTRPERIRDERTRRASAALAVHLPAGPGRPAISFDGFRCNALQERTPPHRGPCVPCRAARHKMRAHKLRMLALLLAVFALSASLARARAWVACFARAARLAAAVNALLARCMHACECNIYAPPAVQNCMF